jgi:cyclic-di-GMP-binding protein
MTIRNRNPRLQGLVGLGAAIDWFTRHGYFVAIPLNDSQPWDLVVEDAAGVLSRVQVKTTTHRKPNGNYGVRLETAGGNQSFHTRKPFDNARAELLFVLTDSGGIYIIPCRDITAQREITLSRRYSSYRMVVGEGFEPSKAEPRGLQPRSFGHSDIPPCAGNGTGGPHPRQLALGSIEPTSQEERTVAESSFDVVAEVDRQEVDNALNQAAKEVSQRFDFKGTDAAIAWSGEQILITANSEDRVNAALDVLKDKLVKRKVSLKSLDVGEPKPGAKGHYRLEISLVAGIPSDKAKAMVKLIKASKLKVTPAIQGEQLRISGKSRDDLQEVQALLRANDQDLPLRFTNYK